MAIDDKVDTVTKLAQPTITELDAAKKVIEAVRHLPRLRALRVLGAASLLHGFNDIAKHCAEIAEELDATGEKEEEQSDGEQGHDNV